MEPRSRKIARRTFVAGAVAAGGAVALWKYGLGGRQGKRPNVLLVVLDTARASSFSCYGHDRQTSPRIDELCKQSMLYRKAFATDFWTLPSHASILTGLYPTQAQATSETNHLPADVTTLAERLQTIGYKTGAMVCNPFVASGRGFGKGFVTYVDKWRDKKDMKSFVDDIKVEQSAVDSSIAWMTGAVKQSAPFFCFINLNIAHMPYNPPDEQRKQFLTQDWQKYQVDMLAEVSGIWRHLAGDLKLSETDYRIMRELYEAEIAMADDLAGQLVDALAALKVLDDTLVIVTSDHGENVGEHGMIDHLLSMYDTTLHVPLIVRYPERFQPGGVNEDLVSLVDLVPTVLDVCGVPEEQCGLHGRWSSLCSPDRLQRSFVVAENDRPINGVQHLKKLFPQFDTDTIDYPMRAIRTDRYKLIWHVDKKIELYDLETDPAEMNNVADDLPDIRDELHNKLKEWMINVAAEHRPEIFQNKDSESIRQLRSLGYAQ